MVVYRRHDLVWLTNAGWQAALAALPEQEAVLTFWRSEAWPVAARRHDPGADAANSLCVGLSLPPDSSGNGQRLGWRVALDQVARSSPPLTLKAARPALPARWRPGYTELQRLAVGLDLRVYGALAWQALTSLRTVTDTSCIDLLLRPVSRHQLQAGLALLSGPEHGLPLDGEIMFPNGDAVPWKAWLAAAPAQARVLVKTLDSVRMADQEELLATLK
jgi:phosphoribosyl-dephospho-CoA transferase